MSSGRHLSPSSGSVYLTVDLISGRLFPPGAKWPQDINSRLTLDRFRGKVLPWSAVGPVSVAEPGPAAVGMACCLWLGPSPMLISGTWGRRQLHADSKEIGRGEIAKRKRSPTGFSKGKLERQGGPGMVVAEADESTPHSGEHTAHHVCTREHTQHS